MKGSIKILAGVLICIALGASVSFLPVSEIPFETVDSGVWGRYADRANFVIRNETIWENVWLELYNGYEPIPDTPTVNFSSEMLIAVFQGERTSGGYWTNITRITMTSLYYVVYVDEVHPGEGCVVTAVLTYPYQIVKISDFSFNLAVQFVYNITTYNCV